MDEITHVVHHADRPPEALADVYSFVFDNGQVGDWYWADLIVGTDEFRVLHILVPSLRGEGQGALESRGAELIEVFPVHDSNNWAKPGLVDGWDGNKAEPTLRPSIFVGGGSDNPGWHGFFEKGKLRTA